MGAFSAEAVSVKADWGRFQQRGRCRVMSNSPAALRSSTTNRCTTTNNCPAWRPKPGVWSRSPGQPTAARKSFPPPRRTQHLAVKRLAGMLLVVIRAGRAGLAAAPAGAGCRPVRISRSRRYSPCAREAFDHHQRWQPRSRNNDPVIIVGIDSQSLVEHGQWPWPRDLDRPAGPHSGRKAAGRGHRHRFAEPDRFLPELLGERFPGLTSETLAALPDPMVNWRRRSNVP